MRAQFRNVKYKNLMPYCTHCGNEVGTTAAFCAHCGGPQPGGGGRAGYRPPIDTAGPFENISPRAASILCYIPVFGIIPAIIILASRRFRSNIPVRFDAFQTVYLFVAWLIVSSAVPVMIGMPGWGVEHSILELVKLGFVVCWIVLLVKASQNQRMHLPVIGDLAARSTTEQL